MMFKDDEDMEYEEAFAGEVLDARAKMEGEHGHLIPESPWESVLVKWDLVRCRTALHTAFTRSIGAHAVCPSLRQPRALQ
jgi:hypothetical protein